MRVPKPMFEIERSIYGWVLAVPDKKAALKVWERRWLKLFEHSIKDWNWLDNRLATIEGELYCMYSALRWPDLLVDNVASPYVNHDLRPGDMVIHLNPKLPDLPALKKKFEEAMKRVTLKH